MRRSNVVRELRKVFLRMRNIHARKLVPGWKDEKLRKAFK